MKGSEFFAMGGYALYVWTSYGLMALVLTANAVLPLLRFRKALRRAATPNRKTPSK